MLFKKETYPSQVASIIKKMIMDGELLPNSPIKEAILSSKLGISRAPIREALQELTYQGLVTSEPHKGKKVRCLSSKEILDSYAVGGILEAVGVRDSLNKWSSADMDKLLQPIEKMRLLSEQNSGLSDFMDLDNLFHGLLLQHCDNAVLVELARLSCMAISKVLCYKKWQTLFSPKGFYERHAELAKTMVARDAVKIESQIREHYNEIGRRMVRDM